MHAVAIVSKPSITIPKGSSSSYIEGKFKGGVTGIVARYQGQQRVGIVIDGLLTMATACIQNAFIEIVKK